MKLINEVPLNLTGTAFGISENLLNFTRNEKSLNLISKLKYFYQQTFLWVTLIVRCMLDFALRRLTNYIILEFIHWRNSEKREHYIYVQFRLELH
jgi:hypothetical protein